VGTEALTTVIYEARSIIGSDSGLVAPASADSAPCSPSQLQHNQANQLSLVQRPKLELEPPKSLGQVADTDKDADAVANCIAAADVDRHVSLVCGPRCGRNVGVGVGGSGRSAVTILILSGTDRCNGDQAAALITLHFLTGHSNSHKQFPPQCGYLSLSKPSRKHTNKNC